MPTNTTTFQLEDLSPDERYTFSIKSINAVGESEYFSDIGEVRTKGEHDLVILYSDFTCTYVN